MKEPKELNLQYFTGTENYYTHGIGALKILLTDGCKYVAEEAQAYWLFDIVLSYQMHTHIRNEAFQHWELKKQLQEGWMITCDVGDRKILAKQTISYSDFPFIIIGFYMVDSVSVKF
ncbi:hypothetical protein GXP67_01100 [Rhodocytophaga rosea]|uniref:DUF6876 domain-containing protein n=1 Tax=Rhodocytophaga rosea TaxID=2704465 RepID=A0A6C0GCG8_9BACT|nr:DUF6876 family protein [Rhodocytophaga rosea]QHT65370.1 hypothetical protein GXP67_01100 [Rhodocytophaga rosea]